MLLHVPRAAPWKYARHCLLCWPRRRQKSMNVVSLFARVAAVVKVVCSGAAMAAELDAEAATAVAPPASVNVVGAPVTVVMFL